MAENRNGCSPTPCTQGQVFIDANQIMDSCRDKDCYEDVRVFLSCAGQEIIEHGNSVRVKCATVTGSSLSVSPLSFNRGFYQVMIRLYVRCVFEVCVCPGRSQEIVGIAVVDKTAILYGGEKNVRTFSSAENGDGFCSAASYCNGSDTSLPTAVLDVADPVVLNTKIVERCQCNCCNCCRSVEEIPQCVLDCLSGETLSMDANAQHILTISLGIFSVLRLERQGQFAIHATEYCVPEKECVFEDTDDPCATFRQMAFPRDQFCAGNTHQDHGHGCGCGH